MNFNDFISRIDECQTKRISWLLTVGSFFAFLIYITVQVFYMKNTYMGEIPHSFVVWRFLFIPAIFLLVFFTVENITSRNYKISVDNLKSDIGALTVAQAQQKIKNKILKEKMDVDENKRLLIIDNKDNLYVISKEIISSLKSNEQKKLYSLDNFSLSEDKKDKIRDVLS